MSRIPRGAALFGAVAVCALSLPLTTAGPAYANAGPRTPSYDVQGDLDAQGRLAVTETIVFDFGDGERHGITRDIPTEPARRGGVFVAAGVRASSPDGAPARTRVQRTTDHTTILVGDPDRTVTGRHTYVLHYVLGGVTIGAGGDNVRVAWDAIGTGWETAIDSAHVRLSAPDEPTHRECFFGTEGAKDRCGHVTADDRDFADAESPAPYHHGITLQAEYSGQIVTADPLTADRNAVSPLEKAAPAGQEPSDPGDLLDQLQAVAFMAVGAGAIIGFGLILRVLRRAGVGRAGGGGFGGGGGVGGGGGGVGGGGVGSGGGGGGGGGF